MANQIMDFGTGDSCSFKASRADFKAFVKVLPKVNSTPEVGFRQIFEAANTAMCSTGIASEETQGFVSIGVNGFGKTLFAMGPLLKAADDFMGSNRVILASDFFNHLGVFRNTQEKKKFDALSETVIRQDLWSDLNRAVETRRVDGFINRVLGAFGQGSISNLRWGPKFQDELETAFSAYLLFSVWGSISNAQKGLGLSAIGSNSYKFTNGDRINSRWIIEPSASNPGLSLRKAFTALTQGVNSFSLVRHWSQLNILNIIGGGANTVDQVISFAQSYGTLGAGLNGASIFVLDEDVAQSGFVPAPQFGVGALYSTNKNQQPPRGFQAINMGEFGTLAIPPNTQNSTSGATGEGSLIGMPAGVGSVSASSYAIFEKWNNKFAKQKYNSITGGSALVGALEEMADTNPHLIGGVIAATLLDDLINTDFEDVSYYSQEVNYFATLAGVVISRLIEGGKSEETDEKGKAYGIAILNGVTGANKINDQNFPLIATSIRALYSHLGIKSKADAYQLSNQAYYANRLNEMDLVATQQVLNMVYDKDGLPKFLNILAGRFYGLHAAITTVEDVTDIFVVGTDELENDTIPGVTGPKKKSNPDKEDMIEKNRARYAKDEVPEEQGPDEVPEEQGAPEPQAQPQEQPQPGAM